MSVRASGVERRANAAVPPEGVEREAVERRLATIRRACLGLLAEYRQRGRAHLFLRGLQLLDEADPEDRRNLEDELNMASNTLTVALRRLRERLARRIREEVACTLSEPTDQQIDEELKHLLAILHQSDGFTTVVQSLEQDPPDRPIPVPRPDEG